jgi:sarcosine oxidase subunit gamma
MVEPTPGAGLPPRRSALAGAYRLGDYGAVTPTGPGIVLNERRGLALIQLAGGAESYGNASARLEERLRLALPRPNRATGDDSLAALWTGPERALLVAAGRSGLASELVEALSGIGIAVTDLSHARTVLRLRGAHARDLLAKECGVDFHPRAFSSGDCAVTSYGPIGMLVHAVDERAFDLYVYRGFAVSFFEALMTGAREFGCRVAPAS